jgi:hypothetical protein
MGTFDPYAFLWLLDLHKDHVLLCRRVKRNRNCDTNWAASGWMELVPEPIDLTLPASC